MSNKVIGSTFLVAGTTIGAGMIALPMTSAPIGFYNSLWLLIGMWAFMLASGYVMVEISNCKPVSIAMLSGERLGRHAKHVAAATLMVLFWALLAAYISGASSIVCQQFCVPQWLLICAYTVFFGLFVVVKTKVVDYVNRFLFIIKVGIFVVMGFWMVPHIDTKHLELSPSMTTESFGFIRFAIPIFFASFGFHGSIPSLIRYLDNDRRKIYISLFIGSVIALVVYVLWQAMTLGILGTSFAANGDVGAFTQALSMKIQQPGFLALISVFTFLVITTSFLGVALGMFDYALEWFFVGKKVENPLKKTTILKAAIFTFAIPLVFSLFYPKGFVFALGFASMALSLFAIVLPCCVAFFGQDRSSIFLNRILVVLLFIGGIAIIGLEMMND